MVCGSNPELEKNLTRLKSYRSAIDVGLHIVLTDTNPLSEQKVQDGLVGHSGKFKSLKNLAIESYLAKIDHASVHREINAQIEKFISIFGEPPAFLDGHQHVQQLPIVRQAVASAMKIYNTIGYVRTANLPLKWLLNYSKSGSNRYIFENLGLAIPGRGSASFFDSEGIKHNRYLLGYYRPGEDVFFKSVFKEYLKIKPSNNDVFFCHPGFVDAHLIKVDALVESRQDNLNFLLSAEFEDLCNSNELSINRFPSEA